MTASRNQDLIRKLGGEIECSSLTDAIVSQAIGEARQAAWAYGGRAEHVLRIRLSRARQPDHRLVLEAALAELPRIIDLRAQGRFARTS